MNWKIPRGWKCGWKVIKSADRRSPAAIHMVRYSKGKVVTRPYKPSRCVTLWDPRLKESLPSWEIEVEDEEDMPPPTQAAV